ncbi:MAG: YlxR family protein [Chloroflexota bacterium]
MKTNINKHIPLRTCIACRDIKNKRELIRLVRNTDGSIQIDTSGKKPGRGAYLCHVPECWQNALKSGRLEHTLKTDIAQENRGQLAEYGNSLSGDY